VKAGILAKPSSFAKMENSAVLEIVTNIESKEYPPNYGKNEKRIKINVTKVRICL